MNLGLKFHLKNSPSITTKFIYVKKNRSHSFLYFLIVKLFLDPQKKNKYIKGRPYPGQWKWHNKCPNNLIEPHYNYRQFI